MSKARHRRGSLPHVIAPNSLAGLAGLAFAACLTRPVETTPPDLTTTFSAPANNQAIDKIDLLFMIDNSASMGDKQALLAAAVPDMIHRLVTPYCVDPKGTVLGTSAMDGSCPNGGKPEFPPVHDMHIGIVTSSIGALYPDPAPDYLAGSTPTLDQCAASAVNEANPSLNAHKDDRGELVNRGGDQETPVPNAQPSNFLAWFPPASQAPENAGKPMPPVPPETTVGDVTQPGTLIGDFSTMVAGVHEHGCGYEAQNEAWYRFLVQPDPYDHIEVHGAAASEVGIDAVILKQRAAFLRPDSLVAVIAVTDENEDHYDPLAFDGQGWLYEQYPFPTSTTQGAPEGTVECAEPPTPDNPASTGPYAPGCTSCAIPAVRNAADFAARCPATGAGNGGYLDPRDDDTNLRFYQPKRRFGVAPFYPISRYVRGLTATTVPDRTTEHDAAGNYVGAEDANARCVNPLFAASLPTDPSQELCHLPPGSRRPDLIYFAAITGVPHQLLQTNPGDPDSPQKDAFTDADWLAILGRDPEHYDFFGADPHMLESTEPRATGCPAGSPDDCDPVNGREWITDTAGPAASRPSGEEGDLEFACTFPLVDPVTGQPKSKDCSAAQYHFACDCEADDFRQASPLCARDASGKPTTTQIRAKAYPSLRELEVAKGMGDHGIVSSLCPIHPSPVGGASDALFGYRPAVNAIVNRLKIALVHQCLPETLPVDPATGAVPCLVLLAMPCPTASGGICPLSESDTCDHPERGLSVPAPDILAAFRRQQGDSRATPDEAGAGLPDPSTFPVCQLNQIVPGDTAQYAACRAGDRAAPPGWCYAEGATTPGACAQGIFFSDGEPPPGADARLTCLERSPAPAAAR